MTNTMKTHIKLLSTVLQINGVGDGVSQGQGLPADSAGARIHLSNRPGEGREGQRMALLRIYYFRKEIVTLPEEVSRGNLPVKYHCNCTNGLKRLEERVLSLKIRLTTAFYRLFAGVEVALMYLRKMLTHVGIYFRHELTQNRKVRVMIRLAS